MVRTIFMNCRRQTIIDSVSQSGYRLRRVGPCLTSWRVLTLMAIGCTFAIIGCNEPERIRTYSVARTESAGKPLVTSRMLAAIIPHGDEAWFFKLTGPDAATNSQREAFEKLIQTVKFPAGAEGDPQWTLPEGWTQQPGSAMRFATLEVSADGETLECSVSKLPLNGQPLEDYLLANINRWRGQLQLPPIEVADLPKEAKTVKLTDGELAATLINIVGSSAGSPMGGMGSAPFAGGGKSRPVSPPSSDSTSPKLSFKAPPNWTPGELESSRGGFSVRRDAVFEVKDGDHRIEITITKLPAAAGATLPNVNRWRGQIGLDALSPEQFEKENKQIEVAGTPADYVQLSGSEQSILGVIAERDGMAWFIKLQGDKELAAAEQQHFEDFVRSIRF